ncbi:methyltransferase domain-containing protein [Streptomyces albus subsp. chlorinus]|uniref:class I SAM-dependent methyltransferase n=1 Tax=Streptomyces albus TaxID=1888 RepID=UPI0015712299|nr:class I SAM-dependent methyltransferase [Streptomyces albus]NSC24369.1 methyltransferase domain-containing protein [Streptomyces albus subsp. chlorinus]
MGKAPSHTPLQTPPRAPAQTPPQTPGYAFGTASGAEAGAAHRSEQYRWLAAAYDAATFDRLASAGVGPGWRCLEIGAGGGTVAHWLAERAAPGGHVTATDLAPQHIAPRPGLTTLTHDVSRDPLPEAAYDLIVARLVLQHVPDRVEVLAKLVRALAPGGLLHIEEFDTSYEPPLLTPDEESARDYEAFLAAKCAVFRAAGGDPHWGRQVPSALRHAGLTDIDVRPRIELRTADSPGLRLQLNHTYQLEERLLAEGLTPRQLSRVRDLMRDPSFRAASSVLYTVQGRRPGRGAAA